MRIIDYNAPAAGFYASLKIAGPDTQSYLQAILSADFSTVSPDVLQPAALLDLKGRVMALLQVRLSDPERAMLLAPQDTLAAVEQRLQRYAIGRQLTFGQIERLNSDANWWRGKAASPQLLGGVQPTLSQWFAHLAALGLPEVMAAARDQYVAQSLLLDRLGAMSFRKGCYPGQEIVARIHFKGAVKRLMYRLQSPAIADPVVIGTPVTAASGKKLGLVLYSGHDGSVATGVAVLSTGWDESSPVVLDQHPWQATAI